MPRTFLQISHLRPNMPGIGRELRRRGPSFLIILHDGDTAIEGLAQVPGHAPVRAGGLQDIGIGRDIPEDEGIRIVGPHVQGEVVFAHGGDDIYGETGRASNRGIGEWLAEALPFWLFSPSQFRWTRN